MEGATPFEAERSRLLGSISQSFNQISVKINSLSREIEVAKKMVDSADGVWKVWEGWEEVHGAGKGERVAISRSTTNEGLQSSKRDTSVF